jgi:hypothetical protein
VPKGEWEKKPFNPILGEQFYCNWDDGTRIICEQVSHHPPVSGFYITNDNAGIQLMGHDGQKTRFSGTQMLVDQIGYCTLKLTGKHDESYLFTLPSLSVNGIWYAGTVTNDTQRHIACHLSGQRLILIIIFTFSSLR